MNELIQFDKELLLMLNGSDSVFLDGVVLVLTNAKTWIPLYLSLLYVVIRNNINWRTIFLVIASAALLVLLAGTVDDEIVKPLVARWRPTHDPQIGHLVDVVNDYRGGSYGFFSAHASNTFRETSGQIEQNLRHEIAGVTQRFQALFLCLTDQLVVGLLQKVIKCDQVFQVFHLQAPLEIFAFKKQSFNNVILYISVYHLIHYENSRFVVNCQTKCWVSGHDIW